MKKLTVDYIAHNAKRVTIEVPDDVDEENINPYGEHQPLRLLR